MHSERVTNFSSNVESNPYHFGAYIESLVVGTEDEVFLLKDTGFETTRQIEMYFKLRSDNPDLTNMEINQLFATRTDSDIRSYEREFLARQPILINHLSAEHTGDGYQIYGSKYNQRLVDVTTDTERRGAIKEALFELEQKIPQVSADTLFAIHSPSGWVMDGHDDLPEDQIYLFKVGKDKSLSAATIRLSMNLNEHEQILGLENEGSYKDRLVNASRKVAEFEGVDFMDYLKAIESQTDRKIAWVDKDKKGDIIKVHTFFDLKNKLSDIHRLTEVDESVDEIAQTLNWFLRADIDFSEPENTKILIRALGKAALDMQHALEEKNGDSKPKNYQQLARRAQELGGCVVSLSKPKNNAELRKLGYSERTCRNCGRLKLCGPCTKMCLACEKLFGVY